MICTRKCKINTTILTNCYNENLCACVFLLLRLMPLLKWYKNTWIKIQQLLKQIEVPTYCYYKCEFKIQYILLVNQSFRHCWRTLVLLVDYYSAGQDQIWSPYSGKFCVASCRCLKCSTFVRVALTEIRKLNMWHFFWQDFSIVELVYAAGLLGILP